ncbi:6-hydroxynicotinate 3-monooxygenase [Pleurostoma richardsiae]|uniref:6-hydroxynicotinate 3-monooxygenase n=1 Tax=Pleurostoma richardsiae TaxID=41990 RepID=A0AA38VL43_9PEZI|nr:6-hydroxynicotinate 3-monooxygenase [Pleurostoma richardsiae]
MVEFQRLPPSGIKVIIVGAGFAGLTAAIECDRKGHSVTVLEKVPELKPLGDIISFGQNSSRIFARWPGVTEALDPIIHKTDSINYLNWQGKFVTTQSFAAENIWGRRINGHRGEIHAAIFNHAKARGIDIRLGQNVTDYFEDEHRAGVEANGHRLVADVVFAAEGVRSRGRKIVLGFEDKPQPSGYAVYRAWFPAGELAKNEKTKHLVQGDSHNAWIGQDIHFIAAAIKDGKEMSWVCTHKDDSDIEESWQFPGNVDDVLRCLQGWDPVVLELVKATPKDRLFDYKLVFRDPLPTFISPKARIALIGDAAHPFLPTSIQGASQSMEDGVTLAACLDIAGKDKVQEALRVYEKIRYERVHKVQATGVSTRDGWHKADWDKIWKDPQSLHLPREEWILNFDTEEDVYESYERIAKAIS